MMIPASPDHRTDDLSGSGSAETAAGPEQDTVNGPALEIDVPVEGQSVGGTPELCSFNVEPTFGTGFSTVVPVLSQNHLDDIETPLASIPAGIFSDDLLAEGIDSFYSLTSQPAQEDMGLTR